jgi:hypothetical protein
VPIGDIVGLNCLVCLVSLRLVWLCAPLLYPVASLVKQGYRCASTQHKRGTYRQFHCNLQECSDLNPVNTRPN